MLSGSLLGCLDTGMKWSGASEKPLQQWMAILRRHHPVLRQAIHNILHPRIGDIPSGERRDKALLSLL